MTPEHASLSETFGSAAPGTLQAKKDLELVYFQSERALNPQHAMFASTDLSGLLPKIESLAAHILGSRTLAKETAQDVLSDFVVHHQAKLRTPQACEAYLQILTVRRCRRLKFQQIRHVDLDAAGASLASEEPSPELQLMEADDAETNRRKLAGCMEKLDPNAIRLLRLRYHLGLTQDAIGRQLGVSKQYVGRILARAVAALKSCVEVAT